MRRAAPIAALLAGLLLGVPRLAHAQSAADGTTPLALTPGAPAGSFALSGFESVNLYNGNLNFHLPLLTISGRGEAQTTLMLAIERRWLLRREPTPEPNLFRYLPDVEWWSTKVSYGPGVMMIREAVQGVVMDQHQIIARTALTRFTFTHPDGTEQEFRDVAPGIEGRPLGWPERFKNRGAVFVATDGSGATFVSDSVIWDPTSEVGETRRARSGRLLFRDGTEYRIGDPSGNLALAGLVTRIRDRNGNVLVFEYQAERVKSITDSLGRRVTVDYVGQYGLGGWDPTADVITFYGFQGNGVNVGQRQIRVEYDLLANRLSPGDETKTLGELFPPLDFGNDPLRYNPKVVAAVVLPNGTSYEFRYNRYRELTQVQLPTGGLIEYTWDSGNPYDPNGLVQVGDPEGDHYYAVYRRVTARRVFNYDHETPEQSTQYASGDCASPQGLCVEVRHLDRSQGVLSRERHYFAGYPEQSFWLTPCDYNGWIGGRELRVEALGPGGEDPGRTIWNSWAQRAPVAWWDGPPDGEPANDPRLVQTWTVLEDGAQSTVVYGYDAYNNVTLKQEYDYGAGAPSRVTETTYVSDPAYVNEGSAHIRNLPQEERVYDARGLRAHTRFEYDTAGLTPREGIVGWVAVGPYRGNLTRTSRYLDSPSQWAVRERRYDVAGNVVKVSDPLGHASFIEYSDNFGQPDGRVHESVSFGRNTFAFPTIVTNAAGHIVQTQYDFYTGTPVDQADPNGIVTSLNRNDVLDRLTNITRVANPGLEAFASQARFEYRDGLHLREVRTYRDKDGFGDGNLQHVSIFDELGREFIGKDKEGPGSWITLQKRFDAMGRVSQVSLPHRDAEDPAWTTTRYDALDRPISVTTSDGAQVQSHYFGSTTLVIDPAAKTRSSRTDALGRMVSLVEDPNGLAQETTYAYDGLDRLTDVRQGPQARSFVYDTLGRLRSASNPESGTVSYEYDPDGSLVQKKDARGFTTTSRYDSLHRLTRREYSDPTPAVSYSYDTDSLSGAYAIGRMTHVGNALSETAYHHDVLGRVFGSEQTTAGRVFSMAYDYDRADNLLSQTYPSGRIVRTDYDDLSRVAKVDEAGQVYASDFAYSPHGAATQMRLGNGLWERTQFNSRLQPTLVGLGRAAGATDLLALAYEYGGPSWNNGNVTRQTITVPGAPQMAQSYVYDELNRLRSAQEGGAWTQSYAYDRWGNRAATGFLALPDATPQDPGSHFDPATNRLKVGAVAYDAAGNQTVDPLARVAAYDAENRLVGFGPGLATYSYDGAGRRVRKTEGEATTTFVYDALGRLVAEYGASASTAAGTSYLTTDPLGNTRLVSDATGRVLSRHDFLPFGEEIPASFGARGVVSGYGSFDAIRQRFTAKERDTESGLDYFQARYFSGAQGRFTSVDPVVNREKAVDDPRCWNRYTYGLNNPLRYVDPDGKDTVDLVLGFAKGIGNVGVGVVTAPVALVADPVGAIKATAASVIDVGMGLKWAATSPGEVWNTYSTLATSSDDADQQALGQALGQGTAVAALTLAPFAKGQPVTGTVWDSIKATQPEYAGTAIPQSFEIGAGSGRFWVHANATEHLAEFAAGKLARGLTPEAVQTMTQAQLTSFRAAITEATRNGIPYNHLVRAGGWELKFVKPRQPGQLPVLTHALELR